MLSVCLFPNPPATPTVYTCHSVHMHTLYLAVRHALLLLVFFTCNSNCLHTHPHTWSGTRVSSKCLQEGPGPSMRVLWMI
jgi:hypothetical protein